MPSIVPHLAATLATVFAASDITTSVIATSLIATSVIAISAITNSVIDHINKKIENSNIG